MAKAATKDASGAKATAPAKEGSKETKQATSAKPTAKTNDSSTLWLAIAVLVLGIALVLTQDRAELETKIGWILNTAAPDQSAAAHLSRVDCRSAHAHLTHVMRVEGFHVLCINRTPLDTYVSFSRHSIEGNTA
jgi:hypothetical protein